MSAAERMARKRARDKARGLIDVRVKAATQKDAEKIRNFARALIHQNAPNQETPVQEGDHI